MPSRPDMTVVIRTPGLLLRADSGGRGKPTVTLWRQDWSSLSPALAHALAEGDRPGKRVWVLDSEVWLGVIDLPAAAVAGQSDKDLAGPAAYEAEAFSDLAPAEAVTAVQRRRMTDQGDQFLVAQVRRREVAALAKVVRSAGAKLAGLGHPAGLPEALRLDQHSESHGGWRRVEFWSGAVVLVEFVAGRIGLIPLGVGPHSDWRRSLAPHLRTGESVVEDQTLVGPSVRVRGGTQWRESTTVEGTARWLAAGSGPVDEDDGVPVWDLSDDPSAERFAQAWAQRLVSISPGSSEMTPTLRPPKAPASRWPAALVGVLALGLAIFGVVTLRGQSSHQLADLKEQLEHVQGDQKVVVDARQSVDRDQANVRKKQKAIDDLERQLNKLKHDQASSDSASVDRRLAMSAMMAALGDTNSESTVIQSIEHDSPRHEIKGTSASPAAAATLAHRLSEQLRGHWIVYPAQVDPEMVGGRMIWRFGIVIESTMESSTQ